MRVRLSTALVLLLLSHSAAAQASPREEKPVTDAPLAHVVETASGTAATDPLSRTHTGSNTKSATDLGTGSAAGTALRPSYQPAWAVQRSKVGDKLRYYAASTVSPRNVGEAFLIAGIPNLPSAPIQPAAPTTVTLESALLYGYQMDAYGDAMDSWRRTSDNLLRYRAGRLEVGFATAETRQLLSNLVLPLALRQEGRYRPAAIDAGLGERLTNAATSILITHRDNGRLAPNYSKLAGTVAAAYLGKSLYAKTFNAPELNSSHFVIHYIAYSLAGDLATNMAHEMLRAAIEPDVEEYQLHGASTEDSYYPLSLGGKFVYWGRSTYAPRNFVQAALTAGLPTIADQPAEPQPGPIDTDQQALAYDQVFVAYGNTIEAWRRDLESNVRYHEHRLIGGFAASESQMVLQNFLLPVTFNIDPRYIMLGPGHVTSARIGHAFRGLVMARTDAGGHTINLPVLLGTAGGALLAQQVYYPALGTPSLTSNSILARTITLNLAVDLLSNMKNEFFHRRGL